MLVHLILYIVTFTAFHRISWRLCSCQFSNWCTAKSAKGASITFQMRDGCIESSTQHMLQHTTNKADKGLAKNIRCTHQAKMKQIYITVRQNRTKWYTLSQITVTWPTNNCISICAMYQFVSHTKTPFNKHTNTAQGNAFVCISVCICNYTCICTAAIDLLHRPHLSICKCWSQSAFCHRYNPLLMALWSFISHFISTNCFLRQHLANW